MKKARAVKILDEQLEICDALNNVSFLAYNFEIDDNGDIINGYIILPCSFREKAVVDLQFDGNLAMDVNNIYLLDEI